MLVLGIEINQMAENQVSIQPRWANKIHQAAAHAQPVEVIPEVRVLADRIVP